MSFAHLLNYYNHQSKTVTLFYEIYRLKLITIADFLTRHPCGNFRW